MKVQTIPASFSPVTITLESRRELLLLFALFAAVSSSDFQAFSLDGEMALKMYDDLWLASGCPEPGTLPCTFTLRRCDK